MSKIEKKESVDSVVDDIDEDNILNDLLNKREDDFSGNDLARRQSEFSKTLTVKRFKSDKDDKQ